MIRAWAPEAQPTDSAHPPRRTPLRAPCPVRRPARRSERLPGHPKADAVDRKRAGWIACADRLTAGATASLRARREARWCSGRSASAEAGPRAWRPLRERGGPSASVDNHSRARRGSCKYLQVARCTRKASSAACRASFAAARASAGLQIRLDARETASKPFEQSSTLANSALRSHNAQNGHEASGVAYMHLYALAIASIQLANRSPRSHKRLFAARRRWSAANAPLHLASSPPRSQKWRCAARPR